MKSGDIWAFPNAETEKYATVDGMTLRDYMAAKAMQSLAYHNCRTGEEFGYAQPDLIARAAYRYADAMLAERVK